MLPQLAFFGSIAFSVIAWAIVAARYIWPALRVRQRSEALRPLLILHSFRFLGMGFLVPGVVSPDLPRAFATAAAFGDIVAAALALLSLLSLQSGPGLLVVWIFNVWGSVDLVNAFYQANATGLSPGQLGAAYFIPTLIVPLLLITHALAFRLLLQQQQEPALGHQATASARIEAVNTLRPPETINRNTLIRGASMKFLLPFVLQRAHRLRPGSCGSSSS